MNFSLKSEIFYIKNRDEYVQKDIIVSNFRFSFFLFDFEHREFRISFLKFECL